MRVSANIFDIIILLGAIQGFIVSSLLYFKKEKLYANKLLAILIFLISLACLNIYLLQINFTRNSTFWTIFSLVVPLVIAMPIGPLIYFYVKALYQTDFRLTKKHKAHFYPVVIDLAPGLVGLIFVTGALMKWIDKSAFGAWGTFLDNYNTYSDIPRFLSASTYTWFAWKRSKEFNSGSIWPKRFIIGLMIFEFIWLLHLIPYLIPSLSSTLLNWVGWYPVYIPLAVLVYWLGINGYFINRVQIKSPALDQKVITTTLEVLQKVMDYDRVYLNPTLSLNEMVKITGLPQKTISSVLNQHMGKTFNEFVNEFRVNEVKKKLLEPGNEHLTITGIAFECGFNSQATFQRTFKQFTNQSPKEFLQTSLEIIKNNSQI